MGSLLLPAFTHLWTRRNRAYHSSESVASAYDAWTDDRLLETLWVSMSISGITAIPRGIAISGEPRLISCMNRALEWIDRLPPGSKVVDVGCGIGGSARILARDYGFDVLGISISPAQIRRATELTPEGLSCRFAVMDALDLNLADGEFDGVRRLKPVLTCQTNSASPMSC